MAKIVKVTEADLTRLVNKVIKEQAAVAAGQSAPQNMTGNDRISNLANMMRNLSVKQVPQKVIVAPGSQLNGMLWTDYLKQFKITKQELAQANALMSKLGVNPQSQKPGPGGKPTNATPLGVKPTPPVRDNIPQKPTPPTGGAPLTPQKPMGGPKPTGGAPLTPQQQRIQQRQQRIQQ